MSAQSVEGSRTFPVYTCVLALVPGTLSSGASMTFAGSCERMRKATSVSSGWRGTVSFCKPRSTSASVDRSSYKRCCCMDLAVLTAGGVLQGTLAAFGPVLPTMASTRAQ
eukprot:4719285-Amphidinium_carterae.1